MNARANTETGEITGLALLRQPFPPNQISKLPKPYKKDSPKGNCSECGGYHGLPAMHLDYVGHAALTDRLLDADPMWSWEPVGLRDGLPAFDETGGLWIRLTVCGVTRLGYGNAEAKSYMDRGAREKECIGDALRNAAMRFGAALDLWHKGNLHEESEMARQDRKDKHLPMDRITSTTGAGEGLTAERKGEIEHLAKRCMDHLHSGNETAVADATALADEAEMDADEAVFFWTFFDSKQRSAMKAEFRARAKRAQEALLATPAL